jgi:formyltetrahydrofolate-dependent phosphoribosylglycinamide formyltransferase
MTQRRTAGILISGRGSNMLALLRAAAAPGYPVRIGVVISDRPSAPGLALAETAGVPALAIGAKTFGGDREAHERAIDTALRAHGTEIVCLAGYIRLFTPWFVTRWRGRMLNIHPSLLPSFPGLDTHARAIAAGFTRHGCTVHLVTETMDEGPILGQAEVPVLPDDTPDRLAARVLDQEHALYPRILADFALRLPLRGGDTGP